MVMVLPSIGYGLWLYGNGNHDVAVYLALSLFLMGRVHKEYANDFLVL